ncbi:hypothetical protein [Hyphomicrobium sp.]|uniref:hypothetical protein n=1 Tax=Hyphomicrobium sp. TaxID=82 RepID=UPI001D1B95C8|nr:hypothetical protein [Hyphomicrobium sp.]MBY0558591.1 hypothetical protein [Hyphomicrobium sp.]
MEDEVPSGESESEITRAYVEKRIDDWLQRVNALLASIKIWAADHRWAVEQGAPAPMLEDLMVRFNLEPRDQPTLSLQSPQGYMIWIKPKGLWVIGANGRVDIYSPLGAFVLLDTADKFEPAHWELFTPGKTPLPSKKKSKKASNRRTKFTPAQLAELV